MVSSIQSDDNQDIEPSDGDCNLLNSIDYSQQSNFKVLNGIDTPAKLGKPLDLPVLNVTKHHNYGHQNFPSHRLSGSNQCGSNALHSDDEVEIRRGLESSGSRACDPKDPQLMRQSTHSLLGRTARALSTRREKVAKKNEERQ